MLVNHCVGARVRGACNDGVMVQFRGSSEFSRRGAPGESGAQISEQQSTKVQVAEPTIDFSSPPNPWPSLDIEPLSEFEIYQQLSSIEQLFINLVNEFIEIENDHDVQLIAELTAQISALQGRQARVMSRLADRLDAQANKMADHRALEFVHRSMAAEIGTLTRVHDGKIYHQLSRAQVLAHDYPHTLKALEDGLILDDHAQVIMDHGRIIEDPAQRAAYERRVLPQGLSLNRRRLGRVAKRVAEQLTSITLEERHQVARLDRQVFVQDLDDGMAELTAILPAVLAYGIKDRLTSQALAIKAGESAAFRETRDALDPTCPDTPALVKELKSHLRTMDQARADVLADMLLTGSPSAHQGQDGQDLGSIKPVVQVTIPALGLLEDKRADQLRKNNPDLAHLPGFDGVPTLDGYGPIPISTARALAGGAQGWDRLILDPVKAMVITADQYVPSKQLRQFMVARDIHCRFPTCTFPARRSDLDHTIAWEHSGTTTPNNLEHLCRWHHTLKHNSSWKISINDQGVSTWTSPAGRTYVDLPPSGEYFRAPPGTLPLRPPETAVFSEGSDQNGASGQQGPAHQSGPGTFPGPQNHPPDWGDPPF